jgi:peptidoglycan/xylan/chitin deacetylase (PgdA/CDA1 family)
VGRFRKSIKRVLQVTIPDRYIMWRRSGNGHPLYLTFDDGPNPEHTPRILEALDELGVKATFFLIGERAGAYPELVRDITSRGHGVGNHSWSHRVLPSLKRDDYAAEIDRTRELLGELCGRSIDMFRPPKGLVSFPALRYLAASGYQVVLWSVDSMDYLRESEETVMRTMRQAHLRGGDIVLLHDDNPFTTNVLPGLIEHIRESGGTLGRL